MNENPNDQQEQPSLPSQVEQPPVQQPHVPLQAAPGFKLPIRPEDTGRKNLTRALIAGAVVLILAAVVGFFVYLRSTQPHPEAAVDDTKSTASSFANKSAKQLVTLATARVTSTQQKVSKLVGVGAVDASGQLIYGTTDYKVGNAGFSNYPNRSEGVGLIGDVQSIENDIKSISNMFSDNDIAVYPSESDNTHMQASTSETYVTYVTKKAVCHIATYHPTDPKDKIRLGFGCADISDYKSASTALTPFFRAYASSENGVAAGDDLKYTILGSLIISDGVDGYKNAQVGISNSKSIAGGFLALFYKVPGKDWSYLTATQSDIPCSAYDSEVLQKSFNGTECTDESKPGMTSTVIVKSAQDTTSSTEKKSTNGESASTTKEDTTTKTQ